MLKSLMLLFSFLFFSTSIFATHYFPENYKQDLQVEIKVNKIEVKSVIDNLRSKGFDIIYVNRDLGEIQILINQEDYNFLKKSFPNLVVQESHYITSAIDEGYKTYDEIQAIIAKLKDQYPDLIHVSKIGKSLEGRDIVAVRISDDKEFNVDEPSVLFNGLHHAREVMTVEVIQDILESLVQNYDKDKVVNEWVDKLQIWLVPMVNPDGSNKVWTASPMWRKNTRGGYGVDINRNYPYKWGACNGSSSSKWMDDYRGTAAASEPETQTMVSFVEKVKPLFNISYHSFGGMVIHPFGCKGERPNAADKLVEMAKELGTLVKHEKVGAPWEILYDVDGGDIDWMYSIHHVLPFAFEVSTKNDGFQPSYSRRDPVVTQNKPGWKYILAKASGVGLNAKINESEQSVTTFHWGNWLAFSQDQRMVVDISNSMMVKVEKKSNDQWEIVAQHFVTPTKSTQHYLLEPGHYRILLQNSMSLVTKSMEFEVSENSADNNYHF